MHLKKVTLLSEKFPSKEHYPFNLNLFQKTGDIQFRSPVTFFIGENGAGKSTLIEAMALKCGIHIWRDPIKTRLEINPYEEELYRYLTVEWINGAVPGSFFGSDIFRDFAQYLDEPDEEIQAGLRYKIHCIENELPYLGFFDPVFSTERPFALF